MLNKSGHIVMESQKLALHVSRFARLPLVFCIQGRPLCHGTWEYCWRHCLCKNMYRISQFKINVKKFPYGYKLLKAFFPTGSLVSFTLLIGTAYKWSCFTLALIARNSDFNFWFKYTPGRGHYDLDTSYFPLVVTSYSIFFLVFILVSLLI